MYEIEVRVLRELAIEHLPTVKDAIGKILEAGGRGLARDYWLQRAANHVFDNGRASCVEEQAAHLLELTNMYLTRQYKVVSVFCPENGERLESQAVVPPQTLPEDWEQVTTAAARLLCRLSGQQLPSWLDTAEPPIGHASESLSATGEVPDGACDAPVKTPMAGDDGVLKREKQIRAIVDAAIAAKYDPVKIPDGGKVALRKKCKEVRRDLFGTGDDPFNDAWKDAISETPPRLRMANHHKFLNRK